METSLKITFIIMFFLGAHLIIPKIADAASKSNTLTSKGSSTTVSNSLTTPKVDSQLSKDTSLTNVSNSNYEPPNYGSPDSQHGSGTR